MKKTLKIGGGIVAVILVLLLVAPFFIDLNSYKGLITEQAKAATGRDLVIEGDISLSLLPLPSVSVAGIKFGNAPAGAAANMAEVERVEVKVALLPLLSQKVEIKSIELVKPTIILEKLMDGSGNWEIAPAAEDAATPAPAPAEDAGGGYDISVAGASITDGVLVYRDLNTASEQRIENLNVDLSMGSLQGPFNATGGVTAMGMPLGFVVDVGRLDPAQPMPISLSLRIDEAGATIGFSGQADLKAAETDDQPILVGKLTGKGDNVAKLIAVLSGGAAQEGPLAQAFALDGEVSAAKTSAELKNFTATLGEMAARGGVAATMGETVDIDANLAMGRLNLDDLLPPSGGAAQAEAAPPLAAENGAAAGGFALPEGINAKATVTIDQVVVQGNAIDQVRVVAALADAKLNLTEASAQLPGATSVKIGGTLEALNGQPAFAGGLDVNSSNLRGLIDAFAKGAVDSVPGDRLRAFALNSRVTFTPTQVALSDLAAKLDATRIGGGLTVALPDGKLRQRMAFGVGLSLDQMNLDGYMPKPGAESAASASAEPAAAEGGNPLQALKPLGDLDANVELRAGKLMLNEQQIQKLHVLIGLASGILTIEDLSVGDLMGGKGAIKGQVVDLKGNPRFDLDFDVTAKDANNLARMAGSEPAGKLGSLSLKGKASGGGDEVSYDVAMAMTGIGLHGTAKGGAAGLLGGGIPRINSDFDVKIGKLAPLLALGGATDPTQIKAADNLGAISFKGNAQSGTDDLAYDVDLAMSGIGGAGKLSGKITGISSATPQVDSVLDLRADRPAALLQLAGLAGPKAQAMGALAAKGALKGGADDMNLDLGLQAAGASAKIAGNIKAKAEPMAFDLSLQANHPEFTQLLALADLPSSGAKAGPLALQAKASGTTAKASVSGLDFRWGDSSLAGDADYDATGAKPMVRANLAGGTVNLVPFMGGGGAKSEAGASGGGGDGSPWSNEPLDLSALKAQDADIDFKAASLIMPDQRIDDLVAKVIVKDGVLTMNTLSGRIYGGGFNLSGTSVDARATPQIIAKMAIDQIQIGEVLGGGIAGNQVKGPLSLNLDLTGAGESQAAIVRSLAGKGDLGGTMMIIGKVEQTVGSALLGVLGQKVKEVKGVADSINGVIGSYMGVDNQLSGTFDIAQGVLDTQDFAFQNPRARGAAKGQVDLGAWALNMLVDLFGAEAEAAFMSINLTGPVNSPRPAFSGSGAAGPASGLVPGLNLPGIGNIPGLGSAGAEGGGLQLPGGITVPGLGGSEAPAGGEPGAAAPAGGLLNEIPGVGDLLGGKKKEKTQAEPVQVPVEAAPAESVPAESVPAAAPEPGAIAPSELIPSEAIPAEAAPAEAVPAEMAPAEPVPAEAAPAEALPAEVPAEAAPAEVAPAEAAPAEAAPVEPLPEEVAPAEPGAVPGELLPLLEGAEPGAIPTP
ncbi:MAG: AsmA family protein [Rhodospirillaceae bacterium]|nr:AsmA family protein [Rhodospirillaceae bacterium]